MQPTVDAANGMPPIHLNGSFTHVHIVHHCMLGLQPGRVERKPWYMSAWCSTDQKSHPDSISKEPDDVKHADLRAPLNSLMCAHFGVM